MIFTVSNQLTLVKRNNTLLTFLNVILDLYLRHFHFVDW